MMLHITQDGPSKRKLLVQMASDACTLWVCQPQGLKTLGTSGEMLHT